MRSIQKTQSKPQGAKPERGKAVGAKFLLLRPAGYPLKSIFQECPSVADARLFELYAREQWYGEEVNPGCYLFDRRLYPDYAFQVVRAYPRRSVVGFETTIKVEQKAEVKKGISYDVSLDR
ncbi:MAG: AAA family ATPase, partial [Methanothrix sp.]|nr:AAA family ATPase [Methanothrix sp.]